MKGLDAETAYALNTLLEDERACVEVLLELTNGATEVAERDTCMAMGQDAVRLSCTLRERLATAGALVTQRINGIALHILDVERYDDRLRAFAHHKADICARAQALLDATEDDESHAVLRDLYDASVRGALWCEQRATTFAQSRLLDFRPGHLTAASLGPRDADEAGADTHDAVRTGSQVSQRDDPTGHAPAPVKDGAKPEPPFGPSRHDGANGEEQ